MKDEWEIVHDCDEDNGDPTCWAKEINHSKYGKYVWISQISDTAYDVEVIPEQELKVLATCKSLASAKRWVSMNLT